MRILSFFFISICVCSFVKAQESPSVEVTSQKDDFSDRSRKFIVEPSMFYINPLNAIGPSSAQGILIPNSDIGIGRKWLPAIVVGYHITDDFSVQTLLAMPPRLELDGTGVLGENGSGGIDNVIQALGISKYLNSLGIDENELDDNILRGVGYLRMAPLTLYFQYDFIDFQKFRLKAGLGLAYIIGVKQDFQLGFEESLSFLEADTVDVQFASQLAPILSLGASINISENLSLSSNALFIPVPVRYDFAIRNALNVPITIVNEDTLNILALNFGLRYHFNWNK